MAFLELALLFPKWNVRDESGHLPQLSLRSNMTGLLDVMAPLTMQWPAWLLESGVSA